jgi:hypothetical protein
MTGGLQLAETKAVAKATPKAPARRGSSAAATELRRLKTYIINQDKLRTFVRKSLKEGVDYGPAYEGSDKLAIYKAGCESVYIYLGLIPKPFPDLVSSAMAGNPPQVHFTVVYLIPIGKLDMLHKRIKEYGVADREVAYEELSISTGRGAADIREGQVKNHNVAVKKARIRALKDAILGLGLSGQFVQDMGDDDSVEYTVPPPEPRATNGQRDVTPEPKANGNKLQQVSDLYEDICQTLQNNPYKDAFRKNMEAAAERHFQAKSLSGLQSVAATIKAVKNQMKGAASGKRSS